MSAKGNRNQNVALLSEAMRRAGRAAVVEAMRDGRRQRAVAIPSGRVYNRTKGKRGWDE